MLSNSIRKLIWCELIKMLIAVLRNKFVVLFIMVFCILSFPIWPDNARRGSFAVIREARPFWHSRWSLRSYATLTRQSRTSDFAPVESHLCCPWCVTLSNTARNSALFASHLSAVYVKSLRRPQNRNFITITLSSEEIQAVATVNMHTVNLEKFGTGVFTSRC